MILLYIYLSFSLLFGVALALIEYYLETKVGNKVNLKDSLTTFAIGFLPGYNIIGVYFAIWCLKVELGNKDYEGDDYE